MSTLKTHNLQSPDSGSANVALAPNAGMVVTGISTFSGNVIVNDKVGIGTDTPNGDLQIRAGQNANLRVLADPSTSGLFVGNYGSGDGYRSLSLLGSNIRLYTITAGALSGAQERVHITSGGAFQISGADDQDNLLVKAGNTHLAVHQDDSDGEVSLRAQDGSGSNNSKYMTFFTNPSGSAAAERLRITPAGDMGLGVIDATILNDSGFRELTIGGLAEGAAIHLQDVDGNVKFGIFTSDVTAAAIIRTITNHPLHFRTNNTERLRIMSTGSVRIGSNNVYTFTADTGADDFVVGEANNGVNRGMTIYNHSGSDGRICFAQPDDVDAGMIKYSHGSDIMQFYVEGSERVRIDSGGNLKQGTSTPSAFTGGAPNNTQRFLGKKCMQGSVTSTTTLDGSGNGTFDLGRLWITDDSSVELFIHVCRNDSATYTTTYAKGFIQKVRGTGMSQGHILYQRSAASGFSLSNLSSGGYTGGSSAHGTQIDCSGGAGGVIYRMVCFYTTISKNDMY